MGKKRSTTTNKKSPAKKATNNKSKLSTQEILESRVFSTAMTVAGQYAASKKKVFRLLQHAFNKLRDESSRNHLAQEWKQQTSTLMRLIRAYYEGAYRKIPVRALLRIIGGLTYFVWVIDLVPDFIPLLGLADDIAVLVWVYNSVKDELDEFEQWESVTAINIEEK